MQVREATAADCERAASILAAVAEEGLIATEPPVDVTARTQRFRELLTSEKRDTLFVLTDDAEVVGIAGVHEGPPGVLSLGMAILPAMRGAGGGKLLLEAVARYAERSGAHKLDLEVWPDNERALALYESFGFEVEGVRRDHYRRRDGSLRSAIVMGKRIGTGRPASRQASGPSRQDD